MGHRANYALIESGQTALYYSHWGAKSVPAQLLAGPERTTAYIRTLEPTAELMDTVWVEGGILLDADQGRLLFWGGESIAISPYLRRLLLPLLRQLWPGWSVTWAAQGIADFARYLDIDVSLVLDGEFAEGFDPPITGEELRADVADEYLTTLLTVRWEDDHIADYIFTYLPGIILGAGPSLLDVLRTRGPRILPHEGCEDQQGGAYFDVPAATMWVWNWDTIDPRYIEALGNRWPGWRVESHVEGLVRQVDLSGRSATGMMIAQADAIRELVDELITDMTIDPSGLLPLLTSDAPPNTDRIEIQPDFFRVDAPSITGEERRQLLEQLFRDAQEEAGREGDI